MMTNKKRYRGSGMVSFAAGLFLFISSCLPAFAGGKTIGVIMSGDIPYFRNTHEAFLTAMSAAGFGPDRVETHVQTPAPDPISWANAAKKFVAYGVDMVVCYGAPAALAVLKETSKTPVLFAAVHAPEALEMTTKNSTGVSSTVPVVTVIKNLKSISGFSRLGVLFSPAESGSVLQVEEIRKLQEKFAFQAVLFDVRRDNDVQKITNVDALFITPSASVMSNIENIIAAARASKIPVASTMGGAEDMGVTLTISADAHEQGEMLAKMVVQVMQGTKPSALPMAQPKKISLVTNLREAQDLGFTVPFELLTAATRVIR